MNILISELTSLTDPSPLKCLGFACQRLSDSHWSVPNCLHFQIMVTTTRNIVQLTVKWECKQCKWCRMSWGQQKWKTIWLTHKAIGKYLTELNTLTLHEKKINQNNDMIGASKENNFYVIFLRKFVKNSNDFT